MALGMSRREFVVAATGAGVASLAWGLWESRWQAGDPGAGGRVPESLPECCEYAEFDGWLVTADDRDRLPSTFVHYTNGWYPKETNQQAAWRWSRQTATLSFRNPGADSVLEIEYDARTDLFPDEPRTITLSVRDRIVESFAADVTGRTRRRVALSAAVLGRPRVAEVRIALDRTFVPANQLDGSRDTRELGVLVYRAVLERE